MPSPGLARVARPSSSCRNSAGFRRAARNKAQTRHSSSPVACLLHVHNPCVLRTDSRCYCWDCWTLQNFNWVMLQSLWLRWSHIVASQKHGFCKQAISRTGKWSHYQVRVCGTPRDLRHRLQAHACSDSHRLCADLVNSPRFLLGPAAPLRKGCSDAELASRAKEAREAACSNADSSGKPAAFSGQPAASSGQPAASSGQLAP